MTRIVCPYLCVQGAAQAIEFYSAAFGARELMRLNEPSGRIGHAELDIDGARLMLADEYPEYGILAPPTLGGSPVTISLQVVGVDEVVRQAAQAGASVEREPRDEFYGERAATIRDPFGHRWHIIEPIEELTPGEMQRRFDVLMMRENPC